MKDKIKAFGCAFLFAASSWSAGWAGEVEITKVEAREVSNGNWTFNVTLKHGDTGWDHYADAWEVRTESGKALGTRILAHPHVDEQPFTRSKSGIKIADNVERVVIHAKDSVHG